jgi:Flp pilus assembly protein TadG
MTSPSTKVRLAQRTPQREAGQALILFAIGMAVIMGFAALTIDVGLAYREKANLQNAADSAALAGADELAATGSKPAAISQATTYLQKFGYQTPNQTISVNIPPTSGPHVGNLSYIEVLVSTHQSAVLRGPLDSSLWNISARSVAAIGHGNPPPYNFVSLNTTNENHTLLVKVGGQLTVTNGIYVAFLQRRRRI